MGAKAGSHEGNRDYDRHYLPHRALAQANVAASVIQRGWHGSRTGAAIRIQQAQRARRARTLTAVCAGPGKLPPCGKIGQREQSNTTTDTVLANSPRQYA